MNPVDADRWLEVDLYWFDAEALTDSCEVFWQRLAPLLANVSGWRGVIVNAGWLADHVLDWRGDLAGPIPFPTGLQKARFFADAGPLRGNHAERRQQWQDRFAAGRQDSGEYRAWTYRSFRELVTTLKRVAGEHGITKVLVGSFVLGWDSIYDCARSGWAQRHPEAYFAGHWRDQLIDVTASLRPDPTPYGAFPNGVDDGTALTEFFGQQWGSLRAAVGLDAIVLRDSMIGQGIYARIGPFGRHAPADPEALRRWSAATADLVRATKTAAPDSLVIGYSSAASAVADWRVNCVDLEAIAAQGFLDAWIDQTWAGAWNEVGQREHSFWNVPLLGWTYQLAYVLLHAAALSRTPTRHYVLTETFDAWESWDIVHTAPDRLRWGIWAYLHAFVLTGEGLCAPRGSYVSWMNQGEQLLTEEDVAFLAGELDASTDDARHTTEVLGPAIVYNRPAMQWLADTRPERDIKEWIDEHVGSLLKYGVPVTSVIRGEDVGVVAADHLLVQTPTHLPLEGVSTLRDRISSGTPVMLVGSPGGVDPDLARAAGVRLADTTIQDPPVVWTQARLGTDLADQDVPPVFEILHRPAGEVAVLDGEVIYRVGSAAALVRRGTVTWWDPPELIYRFGSDFDIDHPEADATDRSARQLMVTPYAVMLAARQISDDLRSMHRLAVDPRPADHPLTVTAWRRDGELRILIADLEEGFADTTEGPRTITLRLPARSEPVTRVLTYAQAQLLRGSGTEDHALVEIPRHGA